MKNRNLLKTLNFEDVVVKSRFFRILGLFSEVLTKVLTITTPLISVIGLVFVLFYLKGVGLEREFVSVISSPTVLISIAMYSVFIAFFFVLILLLPGTLVFIGNQQWDSDSYLKSGGKVFLIIFFLFIFSLTALTTSLYFSSSNSNGNLTFLIFSLALSMSLLISSRQSWVCKKNPYILFNVKIFNICSPFKFFVSTAAIFFGLVVLLFSIYLMLKATYYFIGNDGFSFWITLIVVYFFYSILIAAVISLKNSLLLMYFLILIFGVIYFLFQAEASSKVISTLGIGHYSSSYTVKTENVGNLNKELWRNQGGEYSIKSVDNVTELKNVWVILSLKDKIIISPSESSEVWISIPTSAIVNEGAL